MCFIVNIANLQFKYSHRTSSLWPRHDCLIPPLQLCAGSCLLLGAGCSPSNLFQPFKVILSSRFTNVALWSARLWFLQGLICFPCISTDGQEGSWEARWQHPKPRCLLKRPSSDDNTKDPCADGAVKANGLSRQQVCERV